MKLRSLWWSETYNIALISFIKLISFYSLNISIYKKRARADNNVVQCFGLFNSCALFIMPFFFPPFAGVVCAFLSFLLNIYMCIYSYTVLTNSYNIFTIIWQSALFIGLFFLLFFFYSTPILLVLFLSFLLNIYMCIYSYTNTTHSYNIFTIIEVSIF